MTKFRKWMTALDNPREHVPEVEILRNGISNHSTPWEGNTASPAPKLVFLVCGKKSHRDKTQDLKVPGILPNSSGACDTLTTLPPERP